MHDVLRSQRAKAALLRELGPLSEQQRVHLREGVDVGFVEREVVRLSERRTVALGMGVVGGTLTLKLLLMAVLWAASGGSLLAAGLLVGVAALCAAAAGVGLWRFGRVDRQLALYRVLVAFARADAAPSSDRPSRPFRLGGRLPSDD